MKSPKNTAALLAALALATPSAGQQLINKTVDVDGVTREYLVYIPASFDGTEAVPVLFNFHGGSMTSYEMLSLADMRPLAEADSFILVYPQGLNEPGRGPIWNSEGPYDNGTDEMGFAEAMIDALHADYGVDQTRAYACGYSNGGNLLWDLTCLLGHRFAAVASVAGNMFQWTYDSCTPSAPSGIMTIHGTEDWTYNRYDGLPPYTVSLPDTNDYWVGINGAETTPTVVSVGSSTEHYTWAEDQTCFSVEHYKVNGGGHDWPGAWGGSSDFDANTVIWEFVSRFDLDGLIDCGGGPETYCQTSPNSNGSGALIAWSGSSSVSSNDLVLEVFAAAVNRPGIFYYGPDQVQVPFGDGYRCVGGALKRLPVVFSDSSGGALYAVDLTDPTLPTGSIAAGETWNFQFWFRDTAAGGAGFNFSDALSVPFIP